MTIRPAPNMSATTGPRSRTHIMLKTMCSRLPCSQLALNTVHQRPNPKTGYRRSRRAETRRPNRARESRRARRSCRRAPPDSSSEIRYSAPLPQTTSGTNPRSLPKAPQERRESPQPGVPTSAVVTFVVAHADKRSARRADHRASSLTRNIGGSSDRQLGDARLSSDRDCESESTINQSADHDNLTILMRCLSSEKSSRCRHREIRQQCQSEPPKRRHHRPRRSRQNHARRCDAAPERRVPRNERVAERAMDSNELERERGITILAKNTAVH